MEIKVNMNIRIRERANYTIILLWLSSEHGVKVKIRARLKKGTEYVTTLQLYVE